MRIVNEKHARKKKRNPKTNNPKREREKKSCQTYEGGLGGVPGLSLTLILSHQQQRNAAMAAQNANLKNENKKQGMRRTAATPSAGWRAWRCSTRSTCSTSRG